MNIRKLLILAGLAGLAFSSCVPKEDPLPAPDDGTLLLAEDGKSSYSLVYSSSKTNAEGFNAFFKDKAGVSLPLVSDSSAQKHQLFGAQLSSQSNSHIHT